MDIHENLSEPGFSESPDTSDSFSLSVDTSAAMATLSNMLPAYEITQQLKRGGQGVVYKAFHIDTKRHVAIKVMKEGPFASEMHQSRFHREAQILTRIKHPNIVAIHDSGVVGGFHYFVMDYIDGHPLINSQDEPSPDINQALLQFTKVCQGINTAHLQGIIHRDLKPGNIIVDQDEEPYVLDFGLAKHDADQDELPVLTNTGEFLGSMPWASPEQLEGKPDKIDLRTDVYALGVILYQMLTTRFPYAVDGSTKDTFENISNADPTRPSTYRSAINDEVETIILRCLQKDPDRRYQNAGDLARDIKRYLAGEPIEAKRDSMVYMVRKQVYRYRVAIGVAAMFCVVVSVGFAVSLGLWRYSEESNKRAQMSVSLLKDMVTMADPEQRKGWGYTVREMLGDFSPLIADRTEGMPSVEADLRHTFVEAYLNLEDFHEALVQSELVLASLRHAENTNTLQYAQALSNHAWSLAIVKPHRQAELELREALTILNRLEGGFADEILKTKLRLAKSLARLGKHDQAESLLAQDDLLENIKLDALVEAEFEVVSAKSYCLIRAGKYNRVIALVLEAVPRMEAHYGSTHYKMGWVYDRLGIAEGGLKNRDKESEYFQIALAIKQPLYGDANARILQYKLDLANYSGRTLGSVKPIHLVEEALQIRNQYDLHIPQSNQAHINFIARLTLEYHQIEKNCGFAKEFWQYAMQQYKYELGKSHRVTAAILQAMALDYQGESAAAQSLLNQELPRLIAETPDDTLSHLRMQNALSYCMRSTAWAAEVESQICESANKLFAHPDAKLNAVLRPTATQIVHYYRALNREDDAKHWEWRFNARESGERTLADDIDLSYPNS